MVSSVTVPNSSFRDRRTAFRNSSVFSLSEYSVRIWITTNDHVDVYFGEQFKAVNISSDAIYFRLGQRFTEGCCGKPFIYGQKSIHVTSGLACMLESKI